MVGEKIRKRRQELFITLDELAEETKLDRAKLHRIETNKAEVDVADMPVILKALHLKGMGYFFEGCHES